MAEDQDIRMSMARAFDRAWDRYYRSNRATMNEDVARTELARKIVQLSREGVRDEWRLSAGALVHLHALTPKDEKTEKP
jgi:hypothetical protein